MQTAAALLLVIVCSGPPSYTDGLRKGAICRATPIVRRDESQSGHDLVDVPT